MFSNDAILPLPKFVKKSVLFYIKSEEEKNVKNGEKKYLQEVSNPLALPHFLDITVYCFSIIHF